MKEEWSLESPKGREVSGNNKNDIIPSSTLSNISKVIIYAYIYFLLKFPTPMDAVLPCWKMS